MTSSWNLAVCGVIALLATMVGERSLLAQGRGGATTSSGSSSLFGSSGALSGSSGFSTGTNGVGRGSGMSGASGTGGLAPTGFGSAFGNNTGRAGSQPGNGLINTNLGQNQGGFVGRNDSAGRFVGNSQASQQQIVGQNRNGQMNQGNRNGGNNRGGNNRGQQDNNQSFMQQGMGGNPAQQQRQVRPQLRLGFEYNAPTPAKLEQTLNLRFEKLAKRPEMRGKFRDVRAAAEGKVVTLRGQVATEEDSRVAGIMARMQPGVDSVQNELKVLTPPEPGTGVE